MLVITKNHFLERLDTLPEPIRNIAFSLEIGTTLKSIAETHHLDSTRVDAFMRLAGAVFFGFLHRTDFAKELETSVDLNAKVAASIAEDTEKKVFSRFKEELDAFYQPLLTNEEHSETMTKTATETISLAPPAAPEARTLSFAEFHKKISEPEEKPASAAKEEKNAPAPFVLHEEFPAVKDARKEFLKGFSLPFGIFKPKASETSVPQATIEVPKRADEEKKTIHYSEYRTNVTLSERSGEFINLENFNKTRRDANIQVRANDTNNINAPQSRAPTIPISPDTSSKSEIPVKRIDFAAPIPPLRSPQEDGVDAAPASPKIEGNMIDLR